MLIQDGIKALDGVADCQYYGDTFSLHVWCVSKDEIPSVRIRVAKYLSDRMLTDSIKTVICYAIA